MTHPEELKRLAEELAEEWNKCGSPVLAFIAGFTACAERMGGELEQYKNHRSRRECDLQAKLAIFEWALEEITQLASLDACMNAIGVAREALAKASLNNMNKP